MLSEQERLGISILVMLRSGELKGFDCNHCPEELQERRHCVDDGSETPVLFHPELGQLCLCPIRIIPQVVRDFIDQYDYYEKYPSAYRTSYEDCNPKWWEAVKLYDSLMSEAQARYQDQMTEKLKKGRG